MRIRREGTGPRGGGCLAAAAKTSILCGAAALAVVQARPAAADELGELKSQLQQVMEMNRQLTRQIGTLTEKIDKIETQQSQQAKKVEQVEQKAAATANADAFKGSFPKSFRIPGTETSLRLGGYVKGDLIYDVNQQLGDFVAGFRFSVDPADEARKGHFRAHARQSRLNVESRTPTPLGTFRTFVEGDFFGDAGSTDDLVSNSTFMRIRQAYGELGGFLVGQAWTNFMELAAIPETVEFNGPVGQNFLRQGQLRYTHRLNDNQSLLFSAENPSNDIAVFGSQGTSNHMPDLTARFQQRGKWGVFSVYALTRRLSNDQRGNGGRYDAAQGWGLGAGGSINTVGKDKIQFMASYGNGFGRYLLQSAFQAGGVDANGDIVLTKSYGGDISYQHWWNDKWRSTFVYGIVRNRNIAENMGSFATSPGDGGPSNKVESFHGNVMWSPWQDTTFGLEYIWGRRERTALSDGGGLNGTFNRLQASGQYNF
jgi:hypothetical protein